MLDKTHSVLQSLIEADSAEGERSSGDHDALLDKHAPSLNRCHVLLMILAGFESNMSQGCVGETERLYVLVQTADLC